MKHRPMFLACLFLFVLVVGYLAGCATGGQPHMQAAIDELQAARSELNVALTDKGGHRVRAIGLIDQAISEVQLGMDFARTH